LRKRTKVGISIVGHGVALIRRKANDSYRRRSRWECTFTRREAGFLLPASTGQSANAGGDGVDSLPSVALDETTATPRSDNRWGETSRRDLRINIASAGRDANHTELHRAVASMTNATQKIVALDRIRYPATAGDLASKGKRLPMTFHSILFESPDDRMGGDALEAPAFFVDLNCDQVVDAINDGKEEYNLKPFFHACLRRVDTIRYRHGVFQDLENASLLERVNSFARQMREMREHLVRTKKLYCKEQKQAWFLDAVRTYCDTINSFASDLSKADLKSCGFMGFRDYVTSYVGSVRFASLLSETRKLKADLSTVKYCVLIKGSSFTVRKYESESDYSAEVERTFEKFKQGAVTDYLVKYSESDDMNHIEAKISEFVAKLHPEIFLALDDYCTRSATFVDETVAAFDREVQFYIAYPGHIAPLKRSGLHFCYPRIADKSKEIYDHDGFDIALAHKLLEEGSSVVCNDFNLKSRERILVVSGPNQEGKTTFARTFGQLHYLASIGCPVPGREAQLFLFDNLFTHFEKEEKVENLRGKLEDDLIRIHDILEHATSRSIIVMNEIFTSTTLKDEIFLSAKVMEKIIDLDLLCVWVTFVDELASFGAQTVSMVSTVVPENPASRTFKIVRRPADGLAYAMAIAQKYRLTYSSIMERIKS
jgi:DNA mismatch repair protein MutS